MRHGRLVAGIPALTLCGVLAALAPIPSGCASSSAPRGEVAPGDNKAPTKDRLRAIAEIGNQLAAAQSTDQDLSGLRESLKGAVWARSAPFEVRIAALDALLLDERDMADTLHMLSLMLPTESAAREWKMIEAVGDRAAERGWTELAPAFVVSWSRYMAAPPDEKRPERLALRKLFPGVPVEDVVFAVFAHDPGYGFPELDERQELAAWGLLRRIDTGRTAELIRTLEQSPPPSASPLMRTLQRCARELAVVPDTAEQLAWVQRLGEPKNAEFWSAAAACVARLTENQKAGLEIRHLAPIVWSASHAPDRLTLSTDAALDAVTDRFRGRTVYRRKSSIGSYYDETMRTARSHLVWGDAISILVAADVVESPACVRTFFDEAAADRADTSTEHGGDIEWAGSDFVIRIFDPRPNERLGDYQFVASHDLIEASDQALFHFHFHVATTTNSDHAGPSDADIKYAHQWGRSCLVLTSISGDRLDVDWYRGNGAIIDLGAIDDSTKRSR